MVEENKSWTISKENEVTDLKVLIDNAFKRYGKKREALLPCLKVVQDYSGYLTREAVNYLSEIFDLPLSKISSTASFYGMLTPRKKGKYVIRMCNSLACFVNAEARLLDLAERLLGIKEGETTPDRKFTLEVVACLGLCDQSPAMMINENIYGHLTKEKLISIINDLRING